MIEGRVPALPGESHMIIVPTYLPTNCLSKRKRKAESEARQNEAEKSLLKDNKAEGGRDDFMCCVCVRRVFRVCVCVHAVRVCAVCVLCVCAVCVQTAQTICTRARSFEDLLAKTQ